MMSLTPLPPSLNVTKTKNWTPLSSCHKRVREIKCQAKSIVVNGIRKLSKLSNILNSQFLEDCTWNTWSSWELCSRTCGGGNKTRSRTQNGPFYGGQECSGSSNSTTSCNTDDCPGEGEKKKILLRKLHCHCACVVCIFSGLYLEELGIMGSMFKDMWFGHQVSFKVKSWASSWWT